MDDTYTNLNKQIKETLALAEEKYNVKFLISAFGTLGAELIHNLFFTTTKVFICDIYASHIILFFSLI